MPETPNKNAKDNKKKRIVIACIIALLCIVVIAGVIILLVMNNKDEEQSFVPVSVVCEMVGSAKTTVFDEDYTFDLDNPTEKITTDLNENIINGTIIEYTYQVQNTTTSNLNYIVALDLVNLNNFVITFDDGELFELEDKKPLSRIVKAGESATFKIVVGIGESLASAQISGKITLQIAREGEV